MPTHTVRAVERAIDILEVIRTRGTAGISEISRELHLPKSTVHRILATLSSKAVVAENGETYRYSLGPRIVEMGLSALNRWDFINAAMPYLEELRDRWDETIALALKVRDKYTYIARAMSKTEYFFTPLIGIHYPLHWAASGRALLAFIPEEELGMFIGTNRLIPCTDQTITDLAVLNKELERIRAVGYATSFGERVNGAGAISAPIRNRRGWAFSAVTLIAPESRLREKGLEAVGTSIVDVCSRIEVICHLTGNSYPSISS